MLGSSSCQVTRGFHFSQAYPMGIVLAKLRRDLKDSCLNPPNHHLEVVRDSCSTGKINHRLPINLVCSILTLRRSLIEGRRPFFSAAYVQLRKAFLICPGSRQLLFVFLMPCWALHHLTSQKYPGSRRLSRDKNAFFVARRLSCPAIACSGPASRKDHLPVGFCLPCRASWVAGIAVPACIRRHFGFGGTESLAMPTTDTAFAEYRFAFRP